MPIVFLITAVTLATPLSLLPLGVVFLGTLYWSSPYIEMLIEILEVWIPSISEVSEVYVFEVANYMDLF